MSFQAPKNHTANYWHADEEKNCIVCTLCPRQCQLSEGQRGFCFVRAHHDGKLILETYGRASGFCIDPIEKKPLNHFYPGTGVLSFGTAGCNLGCRFCQNWDLSRSKEFDGFCQDASPAAIALAAKQNKCKSVAFTYNDPVVFTEYAIDVATECHQRDVKTVAVTAGYINNPARKDFFQHIDAANVDLKSFSEDFYRKHVSGKLKPVLETLLYLKHETNVWLEITTLLIPQENDSDDEIEALTSWIVRELGVDVPLHFTAFHPDYRLTDRSPTLPHTLSQARKIALSKGIQYVYTGNVSDTIGASTYCHHCGYLLIERNWYELRKYHFENRNQCPQCHNICAGHFDKQHGQWGAKRQPIQIAEYQ